VTAFGGGLPGDGSEGALEEVVVDDVALAIFAFDDPVAGEGFALAGVGEDEGGVEALRGVDEKGSAGTKGVHQTFSCRHSFCRQELFQQVAYKKGVMVFVDFRKGSCPFLLMWLLVAHWCGEADSTVARLN
jgi:hypothetical protein